MDLNPDLIVNKAQNKGPYQFSMGWVLQEHAHAGPSSSLVHPFGKKGCDAEHGGPIRPLDNQTSNPNGRSKFMSLELSFMLFYFMLGRLLLF